MAKAPKAAVLVAVAIEVYCPRCMEPQADPDAASHMWSPEQLHAAATDQRGAIRACTSCGAPIIMHAPARVTVALR